MSAAIKELITSAGLKSGNPIFVASFVHDENKTRRKAAEQIVLLYNFIILKSERI
jgi:hypothetical protein